MLFYIIDGYAYFLNRETNTAYPAEVKDGIVTINKEIGMPKHKDADGTYTLDELLALEGTTILAKPKPKKSK